MQKRDLIDFLVTNYGYRIHAAKTIVEAIFGKIKTALINGESVRLADFGTLSVRTRAAHNGRNPRTNETIQLPESKHVHFTTGKALREALNQ